MSDLLITKHKPLYIEVCDPSHYDFWLFTFRLKIFCFPALHLNLHLRLNLNLNLNLNLTTAMTSDCDNYVDSTVTLMLK